ncbi:MAG: hypothetical protein ACKPER_11980 [Dolichospermum sp.]
MVTYRGSYEVHIKPPLEERGGGWGWGDFVPHNIGKCCKQQMILPEDSGVQRSLRTKSLILCVDSHSDHFNRSFGAIASQ